MFAHLREWFHGEPQTGYMPIPGDEEEHGLKGKVKVHIDSQRTTRWKSFILALHLGVTLILAMLVVLLAARTHRDLSLSIGSFASGWATDLCKTHDSFGICSPDAENIFQLVPEVRLRCNKSGFQEIRLATEMGLPSSHIPILYAIPELLALRWTRIGRF